MKRIIISIITLIFSMPCFGQMTKSERDFMQDCLADFHEFAKSNNQAHKGTIFIPEVLEVGSQECLSYFQDESMQKKYYKDVEKYYFELFKLCFESGMVYGACWHENYAIVKDGSFQKQVHEKGVSYYSKGLITKDLEMSDSEFSKFEENLFIHWQTRVEPYWDLADPRKYLFNGMLAAFQLGVSMEMSKLGY